MRWPFVSRARYELLEHNFDQMREASHRADAWYREQREAGDKRYAELLDKYHALRVEGASLPLPSPAPLESFGPLTRAALHDAGLGQSGTSKRAMKAKAELIWQQNRNDAMQDELTAIAVRQGETVQA